MKVKKFPQSCILIETNGTKILIDPSSVKYDEKFKKDWKTADAILITHRHSDHINASVVKELQLPIYSTQEVASFNPTLEINLIKENDVFKIGEATITVVKAIHGFISTDGEIKQNVGFIVDDGKTKLYITSDTIRFKNDYKADAVFADVTAFDASMNLWGAMQTRIDAGAKLLIVAHQEAGKMTYEKNEIEKYLANAPIDFIIPEIGQVFEI